MAVKPQSLDKPSSKPRPEGVLGVDDFRSKQHMKLLEEVWFEEFDFMFFDTFDGAEAMNINNGVMYDTVFDVETGISDGFNVISIHPSMTKQHLGYVAKVIRGMQSMQMCANAPLFLALVNVCIELIELGAMPSIVEEYFYWKSAHKLKRENYSFHFGTYKKKEEINEVCEGNS